MSGDNETAIISQLNDGLRQYGTGGKVMLSHGITSLHPLDQINIISKVRTTNDFGDDPYNEHDFGKIVVGGQAIFWKIDYYDTEMECGSENPADVSVTTRLLTIMLADEY